MMQCEMSVPGSGVVSRIHVVRVRTEVLTNLDEPNQTIAVYEYTAWRPDPENPAAMNKYVKGQVAHDPEDSIEKLMLRVLTDHQVLTVPLVLNRIGEAEIDEGIVDAAMDDMVRQGNEQMKREGW